MLVIWEGARDVAAGRMTGGEIAAFVFTGVLAQTLWQSSALGVISLIEDRENDFSQEIFVSPISRYSIVIGKVLGESLVALPQGVAFATIAGMPPEYGLYAAMVPAIVAALWGSSWHLVSGPTTAISIVVFATISPFAPPGSEDRLRAFYTGVLGWSELPKPPLLAARGGCWFRIRVNFGSGSVTDQTTWSATVTGDPVRLVE